jgi:5-oxopent-3-ene-1,2,5-tricarboxylate decarboxylase/2-hydroxyhepta-2,4-diene-1,7-dioate isomerase
MEPLVESWPEPLLAPLGDGSVYGVILNVRRQLDALGEALHAPPYGAPPRAPVLYIKAPNTCLPGGGDVPVPAGVEALEMGATLAVTIGRTAARVAEAQALEHVAGYAAAIDVCIPHTSLHRPAVRQRCRDRFLPIGALTPRSAVADPAALKVEVRVNGEPRGGFAMAELVRPLGRLIADVTEFMTLFAGDVLLVGLPPDAPLAGVSDEVEAAVAGVGSVRCRLVAEETR